MACMDGLGSGIETMLPELGIPARQFYAKIDAGFGPLHRADEVNGPATP
jgi:hypothetical protein